MGLVALIEKWINERGSAAILREREALTEKQKQFEIQQLKSQFENRIRALESEVQDLKTQLASVTVERDVARQHLDQAQKENEQLKAIIALHDSANSIGFSGSITHPGADAGG